MNTSADKLPCYIFSFTPGGTISAINERMCMALGYTCDELIGKHVEILFPVYSRIFLQTHLMPLLTLQGHAQEIFLSFSHKDRSDIPVLVNIQKEDSSPSLIYQCVGMVVHQRKLYEEELLKTKKNLEASILENTDLVQAKETLYNQARLLDNSLQQLHSQHRELTQFNKILTHDLQEPLRKISLFSDLLQHSAENMPRSALSALDRLRAANQQMREVVNGLQEYIWLSENEGTKTTVNLELIVHQSQQALEQQHPPEKLTVLASSLPAIQGDPEQLVRLFGFLLHNAVKFQPPGQHAVVTISGKVLNQNSFRHMDGQYQYDEYLQVKVQDNGIGFDPMQKDKIFDVFVKLHHDSGKGLGLSLSKKIVENHNGIISAEGEPGKGATITILFPLG